MINFIIYEDEAKLREYYIKVISKVMVKSNNAYKTHQLKEYNSSAKEIITNCLENKIYLIDVEVPGKSGINFAQEIRNSGDWKSQIIMITSHETTRFWASNSEALMLSFMNKQMNLEENLTKALRLACKIISSNKVLKFKSLGEIYLIPHTDILYIEKNLNSSGCKIITKNQTIEINKSIILLEEELKNNQNFFKTHRSCIVNINNVREFDFLNNIIKFSNKETSLVSREKKKSFKEALLSNVENDYE